MTLDFRGFGIQNRAMTFFIVGLLLLTIWLVGIEAYESRDFPSKNFPYFALMLGLNVAWFMVVR